VLARADPGHTVKTQTVFSTLPGNGSLTAGIHEWGAVRDQVIGTAILLMLILAITDLLNTPPGANLAPFIIGLVVVAIGMAWGTDAGYAINPARDFGPRLASYITGYSTAWRDQWGNLYFWVPIAGPLIGGIVGGCIYKFFIGQYLPTAEPEPPGRVPAREA
ncbi:MAG: glycerol uptake facilitator protein, partial [Streptomyces sp.]|nr:glycerol uptake facilitator protein [Streptomyces sp.]